MRTALQGHPAAWFSPTYKDMMHAWREITTRLEPAASKIAIADNRIEMLGGGSIDFWSWEKPDSGRGFKYKTIAVDEPSKIAKLEEAWTETARACLTDYRGDAWFGGTPKGRNYFWKLYQLGLDPLERDWAAWRMPTTVNPTIEGIEDEVEDARRLLPERAFKQEYLAEFLEDGGAVFRFLGEAKGAVSQERAHPNRVYVIGCDWAQTEDFSVFTVIDCTTREVVYIDRDNRLDYLVQIDRLRALCERFQPDIVVSERTGNIALADFLRRATYREVKRDQRTGQQHERTVNLPIHDFNTTNESKAEIVQALALAFERREIRIPDDATLIGELEAFTSERLPSGRVRYTAPDGLHDDMVMSLCFAWWRARRIAQAERYSVEDRVRIRLEKDGYEPGKATDDPYKEARMNMLAAKYQREERRPLRYGLGSEWDDDNEFIDGAASGRGF